MRNVLNSILFDALSITGEEGDIDISYNVLLEEFILSFAVFSVLNELVSMLAPLAFIWVY